LLPGNWSITRQRYPEIGQLPGKNTRKLADFRVLLPRNQKRYLEIDQLKQMHKKLLGSNTLKSPISGYCYPEIGRFAGNNTWKAVDCQVLLHENRYEKNLIS